MEEKERLRRVVARVAGDANGRALLRLAANKGCLIGYDENMPADTSGLKVLEFRNMEVRLKILLRPEEDEERQDVTLRHELRHVWQDCEEKVFFDKGISPLLRLARTRVREGDAFAFQVMGGNPNATRAHWARAFEEFQREMGSNYDEDCIKRSESEAAAVTVRTKDAVIVTRLRDVFTVTALPHLVRVPRMGVSAQAAPYLPYRDSGELAAAVLRHVEPEILARARAITP